jgi:hypothetical protein
MVVSDISEHRLVMLFTKELTNPLRIWVKDFKPHTISEAIVRTRDMGDSALKKGNPSLDNDTRRELMRKNLFFSYRDPWVPVHKCMGKVEIHYIEVVVDSVDSEEEDQDKGSTSSEEEASHEEEQPPWIPPTPIGTHPPVAPQPPEQANVGKPTKGGVIATLSGVPKYDTLWMRATIQGQ